MGYLSSMELVEATLTLSKLIKHYELLKDKAIDDDSKEDYEMYQEYVESLDLIKKDCTDSYHEMIGIKCYD